METLPRLYSEDEARAWLGAARGRELSRRAFARVLLRLRHEFPTADLFSTVARRKVFTSDQLANVLQCLSRPRTLPPDDTAVEAAIFAAGGWRRRRRPGPRLDLSRFKPNSRGFLKR
ncbi:MAG TPA: hypothetical protein VG963_27180 [Polyangiaceae bacterium]|nr:hypothetical protein [Polyangiaceae bacterium]